MRRRITNGVNAAASSCSKRRFSCCLLSYSEPHASSRANALVCFSPRCHHELSITDGHFSLSALDASPPCWSVMFTFVAASSVPENLAVTISSAFPMTQTAPGPDDGAHRR